MTSKKESDRQLTERNLEAIGELAPRREADEHNLEMAMGLADNLVSKGCDDLLREIKGN